MRHDGVIGVAHEGFDLQVLFNPFEEKFYLPALFIDFGNGLRRPAKMIRDKDVMFARFRIMKAYPPNGS